VGSVFSVNGETPTVPELEFNEVSMGDPFEESLRDMLKTQSGHDDDACLDRVLKTANRQVGAGDLFGLMGHWLQTLMIVLSSGASRTTVATSKRAAHSTSSFDKAD